MMKGISKGNRVALIFIILMFVLGLLGLLSSCGDEETKNFRLYAAQYTFAGHEYIVLLNPASNSITAVHSEDCPCYVLPTDSD